MISTPLPCWRMSLSGRQSVSLDIYFATHQFRFRDAPSEGALSCSQGGFGRLSMDDSHPLNYSFHSILFAVDKQSIEQASQPANQQTSMRLRTTHVRPQHSQMSTAPRCCCGSPTGTQSKELPFQSQQTGKVCPLVLLLSIPDLSCPDPFPILAPAGYLLSTAQTLALWAAHNPFESNGSRNRSDWEHTSPSFHFPLR